MSLTDDIIAYWKFDETTGTTANDSVGDNDGTINGATINQTGKINKSYSFDGTNDYILVDKALKYTTTTTISFWIKTSNAGEQMFVARGNTSSPFQQFNILFADDGGTVKIRLGVISSSSILLYGSTAASIANNQWRHIVAVRDVNTFKIYIDGEEDASGTAASITADYDNYDINIGRWLGGSAYLNGSIDEFGIWDRALSSTEVTKLYNSGDGVSYPFAEGKIKGNVKLGSSNIQNAKIRLVNQNTNTYIGDTLTNASGNYEFTDLDEENKYHSTVEYTSGGTKYNAKSLWDLVPKK